jgi:hypothetical protein
MNLNSKRSSLGKWMDRHSILVALTGMALMATMIVTVLYVDWKRGDITNPFSLKPVPAWTQLKHDCGFK